jgi:hypothetical protein
VGCSKQRTTGCMLTSNSLPKRTTPMDILLRSRITCTQVATTFPLAVHIWPCMQARHSLWWRVGTCRTTRRSAAL